jgi:hypothetical protein
MSSLLTTGPFKPLNTQQIHHNTLQLGKYHLETFSLNYSNFCYPLGSPGEGLFKLQTEKLSICLKLYRIFWSHMYNCLPLS